MEILFVFFILSMDPVPLERRRFGNSMCFLQHVNCCYYYYYYYIVNEPSPFKRAKFREPDVFPSTCLLLLLLLLL
jgi:hypothetical protein